MLVFRELECTLASLAVGGIGFQGSRNVIEGQEISTWSSPIVGVHF